jgi:hypothetical protein
LEKIGQFNKNKIMKKILIIPLILIFSLIPFFTFGGEKICHSETHPITQSIVQYKCTRGDCGGTIEFQTRIAKRECQQTCVVCDGDKNCSTPVCNSPWKFENGKIVPYDTARTPFLVCTYNYGKLKSDYENPDDYLMHEKEALNPNPILLEKGKIFCIGKTEKECPEVDEVGWLPVLWDGMDYNLAEKVKNRFFEVAQVTCWGKCLENKLEGPHFFGGAIDTNNEQKPSTVRLPAKLGWELNKRMWGINDWEEAINKARKECKESGGKEEKCQPLYEEEKATEILGRENFKITVDGHVLYRGLGVGSFIIKKPVERFLPLAEEHEIQEWQKPESATSDVYWTRKDMYDYFDYYFVSDTSSVFAYSPSQDSKKTFLWVEYKENGLTKQKRPPKKSDKTYGPCTINPFQLHTLEVYPCCGTDCENRAPETPKWKFYTLGPEIKSILGIRVEGIKKIYPFSLGDFNLIEGKIYRFIDVDWDRILKDKLNPNFFHTGMVNFDQFDGGLSDCEEKCKKDCDRKCLNICKAECKDEECRKKFEIFEKGCPDCKGEEKSMGCVICEACNNEYECTENCIRDCKNCQEICGEHPDLDLVAARGECENLSSEEERKICEICRNCKYKVDYVDIEWCQNFEGDPLLAPFYKGRDEENFPLENFYKTTTSTDCEDIHTPSFCENKPCECYKYNTKNGEEILKHDNCNVEIKDKFLPYPKTKVLVEFRNFSDTFECAPYPYEATTCAAIKTLQTYDNFEGSRLIFTPRNNLEKWRVVRDAYVEFGELGKKETYSVPISLSGEKWNPQPWWEQDKLLFPFFSSLVPNAVVVGIKDKGSGLRWDFRINTLSKSQFCNYDKSECFGEEEKEYPFCWKIKKDSPKSNLPPEKEFETSTKALGIYRTEEILVPELDRFSSFRLKIAEPSGSFLPYLPKASTHRLFLQFPVWEFWNSLPPFKNAKERLKKEFIFYFFPCGDERGFFCGDPIKQKVKITGEPPSFPFKEETSGPPPPKKIRIPHYFNWDASLGAASYWLKFEERKVFHPDLPQTSLFKSNERIDWLEEDTEYYWQVKTCADLCDKNDPNFLQCGEWSEKIGPVKGYYLNPPTEMLGAVQFLPNEEISIWWRPIAKGTDCTHLKITYKGGMFENRKDCIEKAKSTFEGYVVFNQILKGDLDGSFTIPKDLLPTSTEVYKDKKTGIETNICLGDYYYQVRYCTGEDCDKNKNECKNADCYYSAECQEAGPWSYLASCEIVTRKYERKEAGGEFGTCKNLIPCTECHFGDIPKIISNILSCILWTISPLAMIILLLYTGIRIYFSFGSPEAIESSKSIWKAVGIGWIIMLLSWTIVNLIGKEFKLPGW